MSDYESEDEGQPIERQSRRGHADRVIAPASTRPQQRNLSNRSQVHHQMSPRTQPAQPQRFIPPQDRSLTAHINQHPTEDLRDAASNQQYHGDTYRRPSSYGSSYGEAQPSRDSRHETPPSFTPYNGHSQHMHSSANGCSTRADSGSDAQVNASQRTLSDHRASNALSEIYGRDWRESESELTQVYQHLEDPVTDTTAATGGYPYSRTLDLQTGQPNQVYSTSYTSTRCPHGCPTPPGYHCDHEREQR